MEQILLIFIIGVILFGAIAELFGRSKHIGGLWTFLLLIGGIIPGVIALISSPSAKFEPTKANSSYAIWAMICFVLGFINLISLGVTKGEFGHFFFGFFILSFYLYNLSEGNIKNSNPKFYFNNENQNIVSESKIKIQRVKGENLTENSGYDSFEDYSESLKNLKTIGLFSEEEYREKEGLLNNEIIKEKLFKSDEYKQLLKLKDLGILDEEDFISKVSIIRNFIQFFNHSKFSDFNIRLLDFEAVNVDNINEELSEINILGIWIFNEKELVIDNNKFLKIKFKDGDFIFGKWDFDINLKILSVKLEHKSNNKIFKLNILKFNKNYMEFVLNNSPIRNNDNLFRAIKKSNVIDSTQSTSDMFVGKWKNDNLAIKFEKDKVYIDFDWRESKSKVFVGYWEYFRSLDVIQISEGEKTQFIHVLTISKSDLIYINNDNLYKLKKANG